MLSGQVSTQGEAATEAEATEVSLSLLLSGVLLGGLGGSAGAVVETLEMLAGLEISVPAAVHDREGRDDLQRAAERLEEDHAPIPEAGRRRERERDVRRDRRNGVGLDGLGLGVRPNEKPDGQAPADVGADRLVGILEVEDG